MGKSKENVEVQDKCKFGVDEIGRSCTTNGEGHIVGLYTNAYISNNGGLIGLCFLVFGALVSQ